MNYKGFLLSFMVVMILAFVLLPVSSATAADREIGGYVAQAESRFVRNVWNFIRHFQNWRTVGGHRWKYDQYFWMEPYIFEGSHKAYVDSQDLAYVSCHGNFWVMACHNKIADVDLRDCPAYGDFPNGDDLEFLVVQSCSTITAFPDASFSWNDWRHDGTNGIFDGLHQAMGYHSSSTSDNGVSRYFANYCLGNDVVWCAWFSAVQEERGWLGRLLGLRYPGYASAIMAHKCRHDRLGSQVADPVASDVLYSVWED
jgi:hypothetical protein